MAAVIEIFLAFLRLGLTSFGGPVAHLGYFRTEFVDRRAWLSAEDYADLVALCQFLPGPSSSQVGLAIGKLRAGIPGALAAFAGFTLPSAAIMLALAYGATAIDLGAWAGVLHGLKLAALAVVAQTVWAMATSLVTDMPRRAAMVGAALAMLVAPLPVVPVILLLVAGAWGATRPAALTRGTEDATPGSRRAGLAWLALFGLLLVLLPLLARTGPGWALVDSFYRTGALVFGGGHVVLPLLQAELVTPGWLGADPFLAGYGAAQALPGPLFAFAAYAGALQTLGPNGLAGGLLALGAIYLPSFLLVFGSLPLWQRWKTLPRLRGALDMANAAVVGLLLAALYDPVFTASVGDGRDMALALLAFAALAWLKLPPWLVVIGCGALAGLLTALG